MMRSPEFVERLTADIAECAVRPSTRSSLAAISNRITRC